MKSCEKLNDCNDCQSELQVCFNKCNKKLDGIVKDNLVDLLPDTIDEGVCLSRCFENRECKSYTYYSSTDPKTPNLCLLLSEIQGPVQPCKHCSTGTPHCRTNTDLCTFNVELVPEECGEQMSFHMFTTPGTSYINLQTAVLGDCELHMVAVGGGGPKKERVYTRGRYEIVGGGCGSVGSKVLPITNTTYKLTVGAGQQE